MPNLQSFEDFMNNPVESFINSKRKINWNIVLGDDINLLKDLITLRHDEVKGQMSRVLVMDQLKELSKNNFGNHQILRLGLNSDEIGKLEDRYNNFKNDGIPSRLDFEDVLNMPLIEIEVSRSSLLSNSFTKSPENKPETLKELLALDPTGFNDKTSRIRDERKDYIEKISEKYFSDKSILKYGMTAEEIEGLREKFNNSNKSRQKCNDVSIEISSKKTSQLNPDKELLFIEVNHINENGEKFLLGRVNAPNQELAEARKASLEEKFSYGKNTDKINGCRKIFNSWKSEQYAIIADKYPQL